MNLGGVEQYQNVTGSSCGYDSHIDYNKLRDEIKTKEDELEMYILKISSLENLAQLCACFDLAKESTDNVSFIYQYVVLPLYGETQRMKLELTDLKYTMQINMNIKAVDSSSSDTNFTVIMPREQELDHTIELNEMSHSSSSDSNFTVIMPREQELDHTIELNEMSSRYRQTCLLPELPKDNHIDNHWLVPRKVSRLPGSSFIELSGGGKRGKKFVPPKQSTIYSYFGTADNDASNSGIAFY